MNPATPTSDPWNIGAYKYTGSIIDTTPPAAPSGVAVQ